MQMFLPPWAFITSEELGSIGGARASESQKALLADREKHGFLGQR